MTAKEIEVINNEIKENLIASNCSLASSRDIEKWQKAALVQEKLLREYQQLKEVIEEVRELRDQFIDENELSVWGNDSLINFVNKLLQILNKTKDVK